MRQPAPIKPRDGESRQVVRAAHRGMPSSPPAARSAARRRGRDTNLVDSPAIRAIAALVAAVFIIVLVYLVSLSPRPSISQLAPLPNSTTPEGQVEISATISSGAQPLRRVVLSLDGQTVQPAVEASNDRNWVVHYISVLSKGRHEVSVQVYDAQGNTIEHSWSFTAAGPRIAPTLTFIGPPDGDSVEPGEVGISVQAASESEVASATVLVNGQPVPATLSADATSVGQTSTNGSSRTWTIVATPTLSPGDYTVQATVQTTQGDSLQTATSFTVASSPDKASARYFPDTGEYVSGAFKTFWEQHDGQLLFGNPLTAEFVDDRGVTVQYFENARFERNPDGTIALGLLGEELLPEPAQGVPNPNSANVLYFPETQHTLAGKFREFWEQHGGVQIFGFPISEEMLENGVRVQYFERARLELRPASSGNDLTVQITPLGQIRWQSISQGQ